MKLKFLISVFLAFVVSTLGLFTTLKLVEQKYSNIRIEEKATLGIQDHLAQACTEPLGGCNEDWYYWNSDTCRCEPHNNSSCTEPAGDCGTDYYWDSSSCSCQPFPTTTCTEPSDGCGYNHYWDSGSCSCESYCPPSTCGTNEYWDSDSCSCVYSGGGGDGSGSGGRGCTEPTSGCGTNHYWDSGSCQCVYSGGGGGGSGCTEPQGGCNVDSYWDSGSCQCVYSGGGGGGGGCTEPSGGCGESRYWDSYSCSCKSDTYCGPPSTGCGTDQYWDSYACDCRSSCERPESCGMDSQWDYYDCECRSAASCSPPAAGCGENYYWDSYYCSCKPYQGTTVTSSCSPPAAGCGNNYYWDTYSCNCKQYPTFYSCSEPVGGCGYGWDWDNNDCTCKSESDDQIYYMPTDYSPYEHEQSYDRLAYETVGIINCVKSILTPTQLERFRYLVPANDNEREEIRQLGEKIQSCWATVQGAAGTSGTFSSPIENEKCLIDSLGERVYKEINQGKREPTYEEHLWFEKCYGNVQVDTIDYITNEQELPKSVDDCLRSVLDTNLYKRISTGQQDVPYEFRDKVDRCFGIDPQPFEEGRSYKVPDEINNCLLQAVGERRFYEINSGASEPTEEERRKGEVCFSKLNQDQIKFLPPPPEQVPYLESDPETIKFGDIVQDTKKVGDKTVGGKIVFSGKGPPNSVVNIYIYSEPIVVTTKTDENGDWIYELNQPLKGEKHIAYATVRDNSGKIVRSTVFDFQVAAAEPPLGQSFLEESKATVVQTNFLLLAFVMVGFVTAAVMGSIAYMQIRKFNLSVNKEDNIQSLDGTKGKGEGNSGTGSIN